MWNIFKLYNKCLCCWFWTYFTPCSGVCIADFEQWSAGQGIVILVPRSVEQHLCLSGITIVCWDLGYFRIIETLKQVSNFFKGNFKCLYCQFWTYLTPCSSVCIVDFEQSNAAWDVINLVSRSADQCLHLSQITIPSRMF